MGSEHDDAIISVNANTANPHYVPTKEKALPIKRGDFVLLDLAMPGPDGFTVAGHELDELSFAT